MHALHAQPPVTIVPYPVWKKKKFNTLPNVSGSIWSVQQSLMRQQN